MSIVRRYISRPRSRGHAAVEIALMSPWIFLLFMAIFDFGFYAYAAICTQNAARVAALATAAFPDNAGSTSTACLRAREEMRMLPNVASINAGCEASTPVGDCTCVDLPLRVRATAFTDGEGWAASRVTVSYRSVQLFPLPFLMGQMNLTRVAEMRVYGE